MLIHPTLDKLHTLKCTGMAAALTEQMSVPDIDTLSFEERLGLLVDRELTERDNRRTSSRLRRARLKHNATLEDIDYRHPRGLDKSLMQSLASCQWVREHLNILITGPHRRRQNLAGLRPGTQRLPARLHRPVPAPAQTPPGHVPSPKGTDAIPSSSPPWQKPRPSSSMTGAWSN